MVKAIRNNNTQCSRYGPIIKDIQEVLSLFRSWDIMHVKRVANAAAYGLAQFAATNKTNKIWMEEIPNSIYNIVTLVQFALFLSSLTL